jgi:hypothetical protein
MLKIASTTESKTKPVSGRRGGERGGRRLMIILVMIREVEVEISWGWGLQMLSSRDGEKSGEGHPEE